ncbi:hypothetical protein [Cryptosporangium phraense]|uniref:Bulb-type lectin domain-containing protein n=1 Tax=Cryptosporangium phraense TaxID=2593070 RepID=A0A545AIR5_9ACTN|nr:hypothetical protein [Cryptosporangium phraense]TQS41203.1 hypothetical protein FL583_31230 [Cryptosporangium phraense]
MYRRVTTAVLSVAVAVVATLFVASPAQAFPKGACDSTVRPEGRPGDYFDALSPIAPTVWTHNMNGCQWLDSGQSWTMYRGTATIRLVNGDLGIYNKSGVLKWHTNTKGSGATQMLWQQDGNLVLYTAGYAKAVWSSKTYNKCTGFKFPYLATQSDNNLVIYCGAEGTNALWASHTNGI